MNWTSIASEAPVLHRKEWALILALLRSSSHTDARTAAKKVEDALANGYGLKEDPAGSADRP